MLARIVDLSVEIFHQMPCHQALVRPIITDLMTHEKSAADQLGTPDDRFTSAIEFLSMITHTGTHVDAPYHFGPNGETIENIPLDTFFGKAICFDLTHIPDLGDIDVADLEAAEAKSGVEVDGHIVLLNTGLHNRHFPTDASMTRNPGLTAAATHWLADRGSRLHGVEGPSTDRPNFKEFPNHRVCRDRGITHVEWLCNLEQLVGAGEIQFFAVPLKIRHGSGSPVRAFAIVG
jgi:kynurenine formamidase